MSKKQTAVDTSITRKRLVEAGLPSRAAPGKLCRLAVMLNGGPFSEDRAQKIAAYVVGHAHGLAAQKRLFEDVVMDRLVLRRRQPREYRHSLDESAARIANVDRLLQSGELDAAELARYTHLELLDSCQETIERIKTALGKAATEEVS